ncbi:MAG TPA: esterase family protein [Candidatus Corynebacterium avicola]|uniref:Esterase family protein n=1 Tax=Candidatus Corynebacterium avicola TaxID=2838527 RepID=A0A9D1RPX5_9CORY|nr:esterase family protein [Candidatus Corynebacterium avicola]
MKTASGKHRSATGTMGRKILALIVAIGTALGVATVAAPSAAADDRGILGPRCSWSNDNYYVQNCWFYSNAMGQDIQVQIKRSNSDAAIYLLDGLRARQDWNAWTKFGGAHKMFVNDDVNVVMPVGGPSQFYADWVGPYGGTKGPMKPRWETFLTNELPSALASGFGISRNKNALVGLSMGGTAAINLASRHRNQFKQVTSLSGYLNTTYPGMYMALQYAMNEGSPGANVWDMWGGPLDPVRFQNDPLLNAPKLSGMPVYISSAAGIPGPKDDFMANPSGGVAGIGLEWVSRGSTATFELAARAAGARVQVSYPAVGVHNWTLWTPELKKARSSILDALNVCYRAGQKTC